MRARIVKLSVGLALAAAATAAPAGAAQIPWGAGCMPVAEGASRTASNCGAELVEGRAVAPAEAPPLVKRVIAAANQIRNRPYVWGGGHASFFSRGYDCSGAVGYALHGAGLLATTMVSGQLASWGEPGPGRWIAIYANDEHVFMVVAGCASTPGTTRPASAARAGSRPPPNRASSPASASATRRGSRAASRSVRSGRR